jgi:arabinose-5-phosphate isomerase
MNSLQIARQVIKIEAEQISNLLDSLDDNFEQAVNVILGCKGKLIISGMGKSGIIGKKICATLASTGTPSFYLHPAEAYHGDLGMIEPQDIVLLISNSGETDEVLKLIPFLKEQGNITLAMSGNSHSTLAKNTHYHLSIAVTEEACPLQLAPTCSTTATLVMGDALAVALMQLRQFKDEHFARFHPGGTLGRRLLMTVKDVMQTQNLPRCYKNTKVHDVVHAITQGKCGLVVVLQHNDILGVVTDGDIRRAMETQESTFFSLRAADLMSAQPKIIQQTARLTDVSEVMEQHKINSVLVVDEQQAFVGVVQMYDLGI